jgi:hypothetical protein
LQNPLIERANLGGASFLFFFFFPFIFIVVLGRAHCTIYKSFYNISNISYVNSSPPPFSPPHFWNSFSRSHFLIYIHVYTVFCTVFTLSHPFPTFFHLPLVPPTSCRTLNPGLVHSKPVLTEILTCKSISCFLCFCFCFFVVFQDYKLF